MAPSGAKMAPRGAKMAPRGAKMAPSGAKLAPHGSKMKNFKFLFFEINLLDPIVFSYILDPFLYLLDNKNYF
jgi:hypothetical protein